MFHNLCESDVSLKATPVVLKEGVGKDKNNLSAALDARHNILNHCNAHLANNGDSLSSHDDIVQMNQ